MSLIKGDSLLSSISNISVLIKPGDNSSIFNLSMFHNRNDTDQSEKLFEVNLNDICPQADQLYDNGMLDKSVKQQEREGSIIHYTSAPILPQFTYNHGFNERAWMITQQNGVSEEERSEEEREVVEEEKKLKNETKNIPKNYGKAIISFIEKYKEKTQVPFEQFFEEMVETKKSINTIADLRRLWVDYKYAKCMRIVSGLFLRRYSMSYIFNSRISNFKSHIKYRHRICEAIKKPHSFRHIKDY